MGDELRSLRELRERFVRDLQTRPAAGELRALALHVLALCEATEGLVAAPPLFASRAAGDAMLTAAESATAAARELAELVGAISRNPDPDQLPLGDGNGWGRIGEPHSDVPPPGSFYLSAAELRAEGAAMAPSVMERWRELHACEGGAS